MYMHTLILGKESSFLSMKTHSEYKKPLYTHIYTYLSLTPGRIISVIRFEISLHPPLDLRGTLLLKSAI